MLEELVGVLLYTEVYIHHIWLIIQTDGLSCDLALTDESLNQNMSWVEVRAWLELEETLLSLTANAEFLLTYYNINLSASMCVGTRWWIHAPRSDCKHIPPDFKGSIL